jgi:hypothetical protein
MVFPRLFLLILSLRRLLRRQDKVIAAQGTIVQISSHRLKHFPAVSRKTILPLCSLPSTFSLKYAMRRKLPKK